MFSQEVIVNLSIAKSVYFTDVGDADMTLISTISKPWQQHIYIKMFVCMRPPNVNIDNKNMLWYFQIYILKLTNLFSLPFNF